MQSQKEINRIWFVFLVAWFISGSVVWGADDLQLVSTCDAPFALAVAVAILIFPSQVRTVAAHRVCQHRRQSGFESKCWAGFGTSPSQFPSIYSRPGRRHHVPGQCEFRRVAGQRRFVSRRRFTNGQFVLFESAASDLVNGDNNNQTDVFLRDLLRPKHCAHQRQYKWVCRKRIFA